MSDQTLTSLAVLTVNWDHGRDTIDSFVPLVADCIRRNGDEPVSVVVLQRAVEADVGIKIPVGALQVILGRCAKEGLVRRENNVYVPQRKKLDRLDYATAKAEAARQHRCLLDRLRAFAQERYGLDWSEEDADTALLAYLQESSIPVLAAATDGDPLPTPARQSRRSKHVVSAFAGRLSAADPEGFACLETVVKGHILSTVLFYPDIGQLQTRFSELDVYCDTPFLLRAIGYTEDGLHAQCVDLVELLIDLGANLKCFHHTREEVAGVLEAEAASLRAGGPSGEYTSKAFGLSQIEDMLVTIDQTFAKLGIHVVDTPPFTEKPDVVALDAAIKSRIRYTRERARERDVASLAAVARLRGLRRMDRFERAKAIFVTTNTTLAKVSSAYFKDIEGKGGIPICMPVAMMTRLAWVKKPMAAPTIPRDMVIASSYAAINPPTPLWREYLDAIERKHQEGDISDEQYHFLRSSREARMALMDETYGDDAAFSAGTVGEVLAHATATIQAEAKAETLAEREARLAAEKEAEEANRRADAIDRVHRRRVDRHGRIVGVSVGWGVAAVIACLFAVGVLAAIPDFPLLAIKNHGWRVTVWVCLALAAALSAFGFVNGLTLLGLRRSISVAVERRWCARGHRKLDKLHGTSSAP